MGGKGNGIAGEMEAELDNPILTHYLSNALPSSIEAEVELEVRFGTIIDKATNERLAVGAAHQCLLDGSDALRFESKVARRDFARLSAWLAETGASGAKSRSVDTISGGLRLSEPIGAEGAQAQAVLLEKTRIRHMDVYCPGSKYDMRVSVSRERVVDQGRGKPFGAGRLAVVREKERTSYRIGGALIELTEVTQQGKGSAQEPVYEVEVEADPALYRRSAFVRLLGNFALLMDRQIARP